MNPAAEGSRVIAVSFGRQTKTYLDDDGLQPKFNDGDSVLISNGKAIDTCEVSVDGDKATITTILAGPLTAVYPYKAAKMNESNLNQIDTVLVSTVQSGEFADANICMAKMKGGNDESLSFENKTTVFCIYPQTDNPEYVEVSAKNFGIANDYPTGSDYQSLDTIHVATTTADSVWVSILVPKNLTIGNLSFSDGTNVKTVTGDRAAEAIAIGTIYNVALPVFVENVTLDKSTLDITVGDPEVKLTATVTPENATDKKVSWASDQDEIATVDQEGNVHAVAPGTATITVTTADGGKTATCTVTVSAPPEYVTMKMGSDQSKTLKWRKMNLGATTVAGSLATCAGYYFAWGGTQGYVYDSDNSKWVETDDSSAELSGGFSQTNAPHYGSAYTKYTSLDSKTVLESDDDAATAFLGNGWRMPTSQEFQDLVDACGGSSGYDKTYEAVTCGEATTFNRGIYWCASYDGVAGCLFCDGTNKLFFPAAGSGYGTDLNTAGDNGYYWSGSLFSDDTDYAYGLSFRSYGVSPQNGYDRYSGFPVRPVSD